MNQALKAYMDTRLRENQFIQYIGLELTDIDLHTASMELNIQEHHMQHTGFTHGGVTATICDVTTGIAAYTAVYNGTEPVEECGNSGFENLICESINSAQIACRGEGYEGRTEFDFLRRTGV